MRTVTTHTEVRACEVDYYDYYDEGEIYEEVEEQTTEVTILTASEDGEVVFIGTLEEAHMADLLCTSKWLPTKKSEDSLASALLAFTEDLAIEVACQPSYSRGIQHVRDMRGTIVEVVPSRLDIEDVKIPAKHAADFYPWVRLSGTETLLHNCYLMTTGDDGTRTFCAEKQFS